MEKSKLEIKLNVFDRCVGYFSPQALLKRKRAKIYNEYLSRKYEAADKGRRTSGWRATGGSATAEIVGSKVTVRNRSRDLVRNNPYAAEFYTCVRQIPFYGYGVTLALQSYGC